MKMLLTEIVKDDDIYPRQKISKKTVESYVEALKAGATFPPIKVQRVADKEVEKVVSLDGWHTCLAYKGNKVDEIDVEFWKDETLDKAEWLEELRIVSLQFNIEHGLKVGEGDIRFQAERIVDARPLDQLKGIVTELAKKFGKTQPRMTQLIGDRVKQRRASRDSKIYALSKLGWTQKEIGEQFNLTQQAIGEITKNINVNKIGIWNFYEKGKSPDEIAEMYSFTPATFWSIVLEDKTDLERFNLFSTQKDEDARLPHAFNVWNFAKRDERLGVPHEMYIPGQIAMNVLYYFTEPNALVVDPMAGGGSTLDACLVMGRRCRAYDLAPLDERLDIVERNILEGFDDKVKGCDLIFLDPPYGDMVSFPKDTDFYDFIRQIAKHSYTTVKDGGIVAFVMCDRTKGQYDPFISESYLIFKNVGFNCIQRISAPLGTSSATKFENADAVKNKKLLGRDRVIYIFRKD